MATSETRARPRKAGTPKAAKAPASRSKSAAATKSPAKKAPATKGPAKKAPAKKSPPKKAAATKRAATPRLPSAKAAAKAGPGKAAKPKVAKVLDAAARLRKVVLDALDDLKAKDIAEIDVRGKSGVTDLLVIASGTSSRHVKSIADEVVKKAKQAGNPPIGVEGQREAEWVLVDLGDVIVHVMLPRTREFYGLERLWTVGDSQPEMLAG
ncbi:ribosome silencing factor RsfS/YbeB/iojap [Dokdonella fugitiva]|uniref:Ribosomal silencing factor RsfS n=1 Tax=Dokdonella fugitiva TaxID=328517 RepID=A0A4R2I3I9_9GAMM|nr:ribosome silencing factor RsfS/YbeB/iojap [Dokdonella fugitiva]TCO38286.1 ribosome silencing factor RsfS/YbeB/iojap [Dokdonella fugitiva]